MDSPRDSQESPQNESSLKGGPFTLCQYPSLPITTGLLSQPTGPNPASQNRLEMETVHAVEGRFQIHPESYSPRVFCRVNDPSGKTYNVYELLRTGESILWPTVPSGFDFWLIDVPTVSAINMKRDLALLEAARKHTMTPEEAQKESWVRGEMAIGTDADEWKYRGDILYTPVPQADGDSGTLLDHLPEGSH